MTQKRVVLVTGASDGLDLSDELDPSEVTATALHPATYMPTKIVASP